MHIVKYRSQALVYIDLMLFHILSPNKIIYKHKIPFYMTKITPGDKECALQDNPFLFYFNGIRYEYNIYKYGECTYVLRMLNILFCSKKYIFCGFSFRF